MDKLAAAEHWLRGYLAGRQGMAPEKYLLEEAAKAGHEPNALHHVRDRVGALVEEMAPGTKWSRWWRLSDAGYTREDAKAVSISSYRQWPYGPNIDLWSRTRLVSWAKAHRLKVARHGAPVCLTWLEQSRCRGCDHRGDGHEAFLLDHLSGWTRNGKPAVIVNHPYSLTSGGFEFLAEAVRQHPGLEVSMPGVSWYSDATIQIEVWNTSVRDAKEEG